MKAKILIAAIIAFMAFSCKKKDMVQPVSLTVLVQYSESEKDLGLSLLNIDVKITNLTSGQTYSRKTNDKGSAVFENIAPGNYSVYADKVFSAKEYMALTGLNTNENVSFNATDSKSFMQNETVTLSLIAGKIGNLVFKQIYYAGSNISTGAVFRDQFIEIYNNSNHTIYADSLYFGNGYANTQALSASQSSFDWTQSVGMPTNIGDVNKDFIYARYLFMIPGSGKDYPILPGKSIIVAQTALNHTKPFIGNNGKSYGVTNPGLTVDLSSADFEAYIVDYKRKNSANPDKYKPYEFDVDNPKIKNVDVLHVASGQDYVMDALGRDDFFIFKTNEKVSEFKQYAKPGNNAANPTKYAQIPVKYIIDAVEVTQTIENQRSAKRLPVALDGAPTFVTGGKYSSQSIVRKTAKTIGGRKFLQDTNNSANDFYTKTKADPSKSESSF